MKSPKRRPPSRSDRPRRRATRADPGGSAARDPEPGDAVPAIEQPTAEGLNAVREPGSIEHGRWLFAQECAFVAGASSLETIPDADLPEVAFAGRSNVGKSTLVNLLTGRKSLARTSSTPGRTRQINFFRLRDDLLLADLPGYGYARASKAEIKNWTKLIFAYLRGRPNLRRVCLLVDARRSIGQSDEGVMSSLDEAAVSYQVVLTKCDKVKPQSLEGALARTAERIVRRPAAHPDILCTSAHSLIGIEELRSGLARIASGR